MAGIVVLAAAYVLSQFYRSFLAVLTPALASDLGATKADLAVASGAWFFAFAFAQFAVGVALDRYGPRATASLFLGLGAAGGAMLFAIAGSPAMIVAAMVLIGIGCAPILMAAMFVFARRFDPARFALLTAVFVGVGMTGNVLGASPLAYAAEDHGWRLVMAALGVLTFLCALAVLAFVRNPEKLRGTADTGLSGYLELLRIRALWPLIPLTIVSYSVAAGIRGLWAGPFMADVYGATAIEIGYATLWMSLAMVAGTFGYGPLDRIFDTRKWIVVVGVGAVIGLLAFLVLSPDIPEPMAVMLLAAIGAFGSSYAVTMAHARSFYPPHLIGRGVTLMNFFSIGGAGAMQWLTGLVVETAAGASDLSAAYSTLFAFYAVTLAGAYFVYLFSTDAKPSAL